MSNYVSLAELKAFKDENGDVYDLSGFSDPELQEALDSVEENLELITGNKFGPFTETWVLDGSGESGLSLPPAISYECIEVSELVAINENGETLETLVENKDFINRKHILIKGPVGSVPSVRRMVSLGGLLWEKGLRNYKLTGTFGMASTPATIKRLVSALTVDTVRPGYVSYLTGGNVASFRLGDYAVSYRGTSSGVDYSHKNLTGIPYVDNLLKRYVKYSSLFMNSTESAYLVGSAYAGA